LFSSASSFLHRSFSQSKNKHDVNSRSDIGESRQEEVKDDKCIKSADEVPPSKPYPKTEQVIPSSVDAIFKVPLVHKTAGVAVTEHGFAANNHFPSVSRILEKTKSPNLTVMLDKWKSKMTAKHGSVKFEKMQKERLNIGEELHEAFTLQYLKQKTPCEKIKLPTAVKPFFTSLQPVLSEFHDLVARETWIHHSTLCYKGQLDAIVMYRDRPTLLELKTSDKLKSTLQSTYDTPLQCVAYVGAWNAASPDKQVSPKYCLCMLHLCLIYPFSH
uniref:Mitochondrial genome maintenance exonuclease 1 n=1 Tax=Soboliphyme baturini TaxID=241478 RepID=A0A183J040_9BILA